HHRLLAERGAHALAQDPRHYVGGAAGGERNDQQDLTRRIVLRGGSPSERQAGTDKEDDTFDPETPAFPPIAANSDDPHFRSPWLRGAMPVPTHRLIEITNGLC